MLKPIALMLWAGSLLMAASGAHAAAPVSAATTATSAASAPVASKDLLVLFDTTMENTTLADQASGAAQAAALQQALADVSAQIKAWGERHGLRIDTVQFSNKTRINLAGRNYSHMLVEKIKMEGMENTPTGPRLSGRQWEATAYRMDVPKDKAMPKLGQDTYLSDDVTCFGLGSVSKAQASCQSRWLSTLSTHLQWINPAWPSLAD